MKLFIFIVDSVYNKNGKEERAKVKQNMVRNNGYENLMEGNVFK